MIFPCTRYWIPLTNSESPICPSDHHFALFLTQLGIPCDTLELGLVWGIFIIPWLIRYSIPFVKSESCICPCDQYFALFLIQPGIDCSWADALAERLTII